MVSVVDNKCIKCRTCVGLCPVSAFCEGETQMVSDPDVCISCGVCIPECPVGAISWDDEADPKWVEFNADKSKEWPRVDE